MSQRRVGVRVSSGEFVGRREGERERKKVEYPGAYGAPRRVWEWAREP